MEQKESEPFGKLDFQIILMLHIDRCNKQLSRLPHEVISTDRNVPSGCTHEDIVTSYSELVFQFEECLRPYHDSDFTKERNEIKKDVPTFQFAKKLFGVCMKLCDRRGYLFEKVAIRVSAEDGAYEETTEAVTTSPVAVATDV